MIKKISIIAFLMACFNLVDAQNFTFQNPRISPECRAKDLVQRLTLEEKVTLMMDFSKPIERYGIKTYNWWNEALHGVARAGLATVFPEPIGMAATFNPDLIEQVFTAVSDEARAKNTAFNKENSYKRYQGLTMWTPNVNIFRDPRWGRGIETYGEDPFLSSRMGVAVVKGLQGTDSAGYDKLHACAKHFAVHSGPEWNRHSFNAADLSLRDLYETYLPAFKALVKEANVKEVMCAYNRLEGEPCCGNKKLLNNILRNDWGFQGIVVADCGAIADFYKPNAHGFSPDVATASAEAVISGTDLDCGQSYKSLIEAVSKGFISEKDIDISVIRLLKARFELGEMDRPELVSWTKIPYSVVASPKHDSLAYLSALQSITLLQNNNQILPLKKKGITLAVVGPNANDSVMQWGNYNGTPAKTTTILEGIKSVLGKKGKVIYEEGCGLVESALFKSAFGNCYHASGKGFKATYWNNNSFQGSPVAESHQSTPFNFCTSGATVFAPGVNLTDFSAKYQTIFKSQQTGEVVFSLYYCGMVKILVNHQEVKSFRSSHGARKANCRFMVEKGKSYEIEIDFNYTMGDAQLNFDLGFNDVMNNKKLIEKIKKADVVIFAGGLSMTLEGEEMGVNIPGFKGGDRTDIELPSVQRNLLADLHQAGKKIVYINCSGSPIGLEPETKHCDAIIQAWYPGQSGGKAVADVIFGNYNPSGKLPVTFYKSVDQLPDFENYQMKGRTYRYFNGTPLYPFGYGLSYTTFQYGKPEIQMINDQLNVCKLTIPVSNTGRLDGEEVVQLYIKKIHDTDGPTKTLRSFKRVMIPSGKTENVVIFLTKNDFEWWNSEKLIMEKIPGIYELFVGRDSDVKESFLIEINN